ncbi:ATP-binding protein [Roseateles sp. L2-2]|uniref:ATP-binding protein n=1 Tax=Roseateles sp. L2-2 TaxID=3422597 RepID=UPI003D35E936
MSETEPLAFGPFLLTGAPPGLHVGAHAVDLDAPAIALLAAIAAAPSGLSPAQLAASGAAAPDDSVERLCARVGDINHALGLHSSAWYVAWHPDDAEPRFTLMDASRASAPRTALPARRLDILGREDAIARVVTQLEAHRFVTLLAAGGMGKTTVAVAAAHAAADDYPDGVYVVDLAPVVDPDLLAQRVASTVGCLTGYTSAHAVLQQWANERRALVVLDSCEHVLDAAAELAEALGGAGSRVAVLATSREPLRARGEWIYRLPPMRLPQPGETVAADQAMTFPALRLFVERAQAASPGFVLTDADMPQLVSLCARLDGIPLAIEIVAARVASLGLADLSDQLESLLLHLPARRRHAPARHSTLSALLEWSYRLLSPEEQTVLRRLSVFRSGFSAEAAQQVVAYVDAADAEDMQDLLLDLMAKSLVAPDRGGNHALRRLLDTTRAYAGQKLDEAGERHRVSRRHARWLSGVLAEADDAWNRMTRQQWMSRYSPLIDDIRAALDWAFTADGDVALGVDLTIAGFAIGRQMLLVDEFTDRVRRAIDAIARHGEGPGSALDPADADASRKRLTFLIACLGLAADASLTLTLETAANSLTSGDQLLQRFAGCNGLWAMAVFRGDFKEGAVWADRMEALAGRIEDPVARLVSSRIQAQTLHFAGRHSLAADRARGVLNESWRTIPLSYHPSPVELRVSMRVTLARTLWMQGRPDSAAAMAQEAIEHALTDSPLAHCQVISMGSLVIALWSGLAEPARLLANQLVDLERLLGFSHWLRWSRGLRAMVALREGGEVPADADASWFEEPEPVLADHLATLDERWLTPRCIQRVESGMVGWCAPEAFRLLGERALRERSGDAGARGERLLQRSLALAREQEAASWELRTATSLARHWQTQDRSREALAALEPVFVRFKEGFGTADLRAARALVEAL